MELADQRLCSCCEGVKQNDIQQRFAANQSCTPRLQSAITAVSDAVYTLFSCDGRLKSPSSMLTCDKRLLDSVYSSNATNFWQQCERRDAEDRPPTLSGEAALC